MEEDKEKDYGGSQALEGYGCICGYKDTDKKTFNTHLLLGSKRDGKGVHKSIGRVNMQTGEVVLPPYTERTADQRAESIFKVNHRKTEATSTTQRMTESWANASEIKVVPRIFQMDFTPTMRLAKIASMKEWGWPDMPWDDFFDTCLYTLFKSYDIILAGYIVDHQEQEEEEEYLEEVTS